MLPQKPGVFPQRNASLAKLCGHVSEALIKIKWCFQVIIPIY